MSQLDDTVDRLNTYLRDHADRISVSSAAIDRRIERSRHRRRLTIATTVSIALSIAIAATAFGLGGSDPTDMAVGPPPSPTTAPQTSKGPPTRVLLVGDTVAYNLGLGFEGDPGVASDVRVWNQAVLWCELIPLPRRENGVEQPASDTCVDWSSRWRAAADEFRPQVVVLDVGAWEIFDRKQGDRWIAFGSPELDALLSRELQRAVDTLSAFGAPVVLLTTPYFERTDGVSERVWTQNDRSRVDHFNDLLRQLAARPENTARVHVVELGRWLCPDPNGPCRNQIDGTLVRDDGLHYSAAGAQIIAQWLAPQLRGLA